MISETFERLCGKDGGMSYASDTPEAIREKSAIDKCCEYSDEPEKLRALLADIYVGFRWDGIRKYFDDDKEESQCIVIKMKREGKEITFGFGMSINDTMLIQGKDISNNYFFKTPSISRNIREIKMDLLYSILACAFLDYQFYDNFEDFCMEFGYDTDSIKAEKTWIACKEQSRKLQKIFHEEEIECLPR